MKMTHKPLQLLLDKLSIHYSEDDDALWNSIKVRENNGCYLYDYKDFLEVAANHPVIRICRGLVVDVNGDVLCYPFNRFFNDFQAECDVVDWNSAVILEKVDGSLCNVWWNRMANEWEVTTRGAFYNDDKELTGPNFKQLFLNLFQWVEHLNKNNTYMFELVTKENRIVTHYDEEFVVLLSVRDNKTLRELPIEDVDKEAAKLGVMRPNKYKATNIVECRLLFEGLKDDEEGFVVVDKDFNRMKMKQESYLQMSKIISLNDQAIYKHVIGDVAIDEELLAKLPEVQERVDSIKKDFETITELVADSYYTLMPFINGNRKNFAEQVRDLPYKGCLFALLDNKEPEWGRMKWKDIKEWLPKKELTKEEIINKIIMLSQGWEAEIFYHLYDFQEARELTNFIVEEIKEALK